MDVSELERQIKEAPDLPGVYLFRDGDGTVLYVGKALSLRRRLAGYTPAVREETRVPVKVGEMGRRAESVEWIVTSSDAEAFFLSITSSNAIALFQHPSSGRQIVSLIMITMAEEFPRVMFTRQPHRKGERSTSVPYANAAKVRETLDTLGRIFPFRKCRGKNPGPAQRFTPVCSYSIKRCDAPCAGYITPGGLSGD